MIDFLRRVFGKPRAAAARPGLPPRPGDWKLTISDLMEEMRAGRRKSVGQPQIEWARDYERSLIPEGVRFPRKGDVYRSLEDQTVSYLTAWAAPFTGGGETTLFKGERVWIHHDPGEERPIGTYAQAVDYATLEKRIVPAAERSAPKYGGFYFHFSTMDLHTRFRLVETGFRG